MHALDLITKELKCMNIAVKAFLKGLENNVEI